jgi:hypothetical protein
MEVPLLSVCLSVVMNHLQVFAFAIIAVPLVGVLAFRSFLPQKADMNKAPKKVLLGYREGDGLPVYFDPKTGFSEAPEDEEPVRKPASKPRVMSMSAVPLSMGMVAAKKK